MNTYEKAIIKKFNRFKGWVDKEFPALNGLLPIAVERCIPFLNDSEFTKIVPRIIQEEIEPFCKQVDHNRLSMFQHKLDKILLNATNHRMRWRIFVSNNTPQPKRARKPKHKHPPDGKIGYTVEYLAHINSAKWRAFRLQIIAERGPRCEKCKAINSGLHLHHLTYERLGREDPGDVVILCVPCHEKVHGRKVGT